MDMDRHDEGDLETQEEWQNLLDDVEITEWPLPPWMMSQSADLYVLNRGCKPRVAKDIPVERLMSMIQAVNRVSSGHQIDHVAKDESESFCLMRFESPTPTRPLLSQLGQEAHSSSQAQSQQLRGAPQVPENILSSSPEELDREANNLHECCKGNSDQLTMMLGKPEPHCQFFYNKSDLLSGVQCVKFSYSLASPAPDQLFLVLSHHFHAIHLLNTPESEIHNEKTKLLETQSPPKAGANPEIALVPGNTKVLKSNDKRVAEQERGPNDLDASGSPGPAKESFTSIDFRAGEDQRVPSAQSKYSLKSMLRGFTHGISRAHLEATLSKSIVLGKPCHASEPDSTEPPNTMMIPHPKAILLGILEDFQVERRKEINGYFKKLESIESSIKQERSTNKQKKYGLAVCSTQLSETNVSLSQVRPKLQYLATSIKTLESCNDIPDCKGDLAFDYFSNADRSNHTFPHDHYSQVWTRQLGNIKRRLACLKVKCDQCRSDVETLQYRLTGNLSVVSNLLGQRESDWIHRKEEMHEEITKYQNLMLERQEQISQRMKWDSTITKVVAILTAFFLPGTFIAILFTVPIFDWTNDYPIGPHFWTYWAFTGPITFVLVIGFVIWFAMIWWKDRNRRALETEE